MGVQDVVARLNKSKSATTTATTAPPPRRKITMTVDHKLPPSPASSPTTSIQKQDVPPPKDAKSINSMLEKFGQPPTYSKPMIVSPTSTPPRSPVIQQSNTLHVTPKKLDHSKMNIALDEMEELFEALMDQQKASEQYIERLKNDVEKYSSDATKVRDYEIRVEYLALKLEQVSEERDAFEKELLELQNKPPPPPPASQEGPMSPAYTYQHDIIIEDEQKLQRQNNDAYMDDILNVYEELSEEGGGDDMQLFDDEADMQSQQQQECDKGMQMTIMKYITDLETQRLETKALKEVVQKQDELITKLEQKQVPTTNNDELLKEQVEVQRIELENKRELLAQLLNEREDLLRRLNSNQRRSRRSSIELISHLLQSNNNTKTRPISNCSIVSGRGTPPLTAPPKQPLPPLPPK